MGKPSGLLIAFDDAIPAWRAEITANPSPERAVQVINDGLNQLADSYAQAEQWPENGTDRRQLRLLVTAVASAAAGALLSASAWVQVPAAPSTTSSGWRPGRRRGASSRHAVAEPPAGELRRLPVVVDADAVLRRLRQAVDGLDQYLQAQRALLARRPARPWREDSDLLGLVQDLLAAQSAGNVDDMGARLHRLTKDLRLLQEIDVIEYDAADSAHDSTLFDLPASVAGGLRPGIGVRPALVTTSRSGRPFSVLMRGEVAARPEGGPS